MKLRIAGIVLSALISVPALGQARVPPPGPNWTYPQGFGFRWTTPPGGISPGLRGQKFNGQPQPPSRSFVRRPGFAPQPFLIDTQGIDQFGRPIIIDRFGRPFFIDTRGQLRDQWGRVVPPDRFLAPRLRSFSGRADFRVMD